MHNNYYLGLSGEHRCPLGYLFSMYHNGRSSRNFMVFGEFYVINVTFVKIFNGITERMQE